MSEAKSRCYASDLMAGQVALVTGSGSGMGRATAIEMAACGARLALFARREEPLEETAEMIRAAGGEAFVVPGDTRDEDSIEAAMGRIKDHYGQLDVLVNNAGITRDQLFMRMSDEDWASVLDVNLTSTMRLCRGVMRGMMKARWGRIVNISSIVGATGNPGQANYAASKAGMVGMSKSIAYEVASRGITVNCVAPGFITTAMTDKLTDDQKAAILKDVPSGRMGDAGEIGSAVLYLASPEAGYVTGTTLHVNGGMAML